MITHLMLINISKPGTVMVFYAKIFEIVKFDILEDVFKFDVLLNMILNLDDEPVSQTAEALGYSSHYAITNLGPFFVLCLIFLVSSVLAHYLYQLFTIWFKPERKSLVLMKRWTQYFAWGYGVRNGS